VLPQIRFGGKENLQREISFEKEIFLQKKSLFQNLSLSTPHLRGEISPQTLFVATLGLEGF
jgi:hypothetical protein